MLEDCPPKGQLAEYINELFPDVEVAVFEGTVTIEPLGSLVVATALVQATSIATESDPDGYFRIGLDGANPVRLTASAPGYYIGASDPG